MPKYTTEFMYHVRAIQYVLVQPKDLDEVTDEMWERDIQPAYIYLICRRPKISVVPETTVFGPDFVTGSFRVWRGQGFEEVPYRVPNQLGRFDVKLIAPYPGTDFQVAADDGTELSRGSAANLMASFGHGFHEYLDLEVIYVGQSFGFEGSRTAQDRLRSHKTLQGILAESLARSPDLDIWLLMLSFEDPYIVSVIDPRRKTQVTAAEDESHIRSVIDTPISLQQEVNLSEAMLIRHFDPPYNKMFRTSFPNPAHTTYRDCYDLDFHSVGVEVETECLSARLWSGAQAPSWLHIPEFPLRTDSDRRSMLDIFG